MALVGYKNGVGEISFKCGGSIISKHHVLTGWLTLRSLWHKINLFSSYFSCSLHSKRFVSFNKFHAITFCSQFHLQIIGSTWRTWPVDRHRDAARWPSRHQHDHTSRLRQEGWAQRSGDLGDRQWHSIHEWVKVFGGDANQSSQLLCLLRSYLANLYSAKRAWAFQEFRQLHSVCCW